MVEISFGDYEDFGQALEIFTVGSGQCPHHSGLTLTPQLLVFFPSPVASTAESLKYFIQSIHTLNATSRNMELHRVSSIQRGHQLGET
jgi:hypothetical protein